MHIIKKPARLMSKSKTLFKCAQKQSRVVYLKLWIEGEEERLSSSIKAIADFKRLRCQRTKHLNQTQERWLLDYETYL